VVADKWMAINADGSVSDSACFASGWYDTVLQKVPEAKKTFYRFY
jgi:hypothetical protein